MQSRPESNPVDQEVYLQKTGKMAKTMTGNYFTDFHATIGRFVTGRNW